MCQTSFDFRREKGFFARLFWRGQDYLTTLFSGAGPMAQGPGIPIN